MPSKMQLFFRISFLAILQYQNPYTPIKKQDIVRLLLASESLKLQSAALLPRSQRPQEMQTKPRNKVSWPPLLKSWSQSQVQLKKCIEVQKSSSDADIDLTANKLELDSNEKCSEKINLGVEVIGQLVNKQWHHRNYKRGSCMGVYVYNICTISVMTLYMPPLRRQL